MKNELNNNEAVELKIVNYRQALFYVENGVQPIRLEVGYEHKMVYVFSKDDTYDLYKYWIKDCNAYKEKLRAEGRL